MKIPPDPTASPSFSQEASTPRGSIKKSPSLRIHDPLYLAPAVGVPSAVSSRSGSFSLQQSFSSLLDTVVTDALDMQLNRRRSHTSFGRDLGYALSKEPNCSGDWEDFTSLASAPPLSPALGSRSCSAASHLSPPWHQACMPAYALCAGGPTEGKAVPQTYHHSLGASRRYSLLAASNLNLSGQLARDPLSNSSSLNNSNPGLANSFLGGTLSVCTMTSGIGLQTASSLSSLGSQLGGGDLGESMCAGDGLSVLTRKSKEWGQGQGQQQQGQQHQQQQQQQHAHIAQGQQHSLQYQPPWRFQPPPSPPLQLKDHKGQPPHSLFRAHPHPQAADTVPKEAAKAAAVPSAKSRPPQLAVDHAPKGSQGLQLCTSPRTSPSAPQPCSSSPSKPPQQPPICLRASLASPFSTLDSQHQHCTSPSTPSQQPLTSPRASPLTSSSAPPLQALPSPKALPSQPPSQSSPPWPFSSSPAVPNKSPTCPTAPSHLRSPNVCTQNEVCSPTIVKSAIPPSKTEVGEHQPTCQLPCSSPTRLHASLLSLAPSFLRRDKTKAEEGEDPTQSPPPQPPQQPPLRSQSASKNPRRRLWSLSPFSSS